MRLLIGAADFVRWPFERAAWAIERGALWPLRERLAGWSLPAHGAGAAALGAIAIAAVLAGVLLQPGNDPTRDQVAEPARVAIATPAPGPAEEPSGPVLHGASPDFSGDEGEGVAQVDGGAGAELNAGSDATGVPATSDEATQSEEGGATASSKKPVPAGPAAMKVARRFSEAFVFYEVGERPARAKAVFGETATPQLAGALGERPPRLPADAEGAEGARAQPRPRPPRRQGLHRQRLAAAGRAYE